MLVLDSLYWPGRGCIFDGFEGKLFVAGHSVRLILVVSALSPNLDLASESVLVETQYI